MCGVLFVWAGSVLLYTLKKALLVDTSGHVAIVADNVSREQNHAHWPRTNIVADQGLAIQERGMRSSCKSTGQTSSVV